MRQFVIDLACNLAGGARLALLLPVARMHFRADLAQAGALFLLSFSLNLGYDLYLAGSGATFSLPGLNYQATLYLLFFFSIVIMAAGAAAPGSAPALAVAVLSVAPAAFIVYIAIVALAGRWPSLPVRFYDWLTPVYLAWYLFIVLRAVRAVLAPPPVRCAVLVAVFGVFNVLPWYLMPQEPLWTVDAGAAAGTDAPAPDLERLFFQQDELLERGVRGLLDQRPGIVDLYFVGVAGDAAEDVFMNEVQQAARIFSRDFDAAGRTLLLVNNAQTFDRLPLASRDNLTAALAGVARRMDPDEDLLLLFLTSHGEEGRGLVLDLDGFRLADITPRVLRAALDGAGIRYRAVVVSACFSGAFVDELRDPATLVMTSARSDRSSFGCGHDGPFTYFGAAFLGTELPRDGALVAAFERARASLAAREAQEGLPRSEPQLWVGEEIGIVLERLAARLRGRPPPRASLPRDAVSRL